MEIAKNLVAHIHYTLKTDTGELLDSSVGSQPLSYLHGNGNLIPGLEAELEGKKVGDKLQVHVEPRDAYGERDEGMVQSVPRSQLPDDVELQLGMQFQAEGEDGTLPVTVVGLEPEEVRLDGNHALAGVALNFEVEVMEVREASADEVNHGHVHGPGGHEGHDH